MTLVGEMLAVVIAGALLGTYIRTHGGHAAAGTAAGAALATVAIAALMLFFNGTPFVEGLPSQISANEAYSPADIQGVPAIASGTSGVNLTFLDWARNMISASSDNLRSPAQLKYWMPPQTNPFLIQWIPYNLLPGVLVASQKQASWLVFYGVKTTSFAYNHAAFGQPIVYQPFFEIVERVRAG